MPVTLKLTFPAGRYHATPWGRHVNEGVPEWPPSPWRLLRALVATWRRKCPDLGETAVRRVLQPLLAPPLFWLPPARVAHTRHAMPTNQLPRHDKPSAAEKKAGKYQGDPTIVFDTFVAVGRHDPLLVHWPEATPTPDESAVLGRLAENLSSLGRAEGWVVAALLGDEPRPIRCNCGPSAAADTAQELVAVFCPDPATAFGDEHYPPRPDPKQLKKGLKPGEHLFDCPRWHLCLDTEIIQKERWPRVPGARWVSYARPADAFTRSASPPAAPPAVRDQPAVARFLLDGPVLPPVTDTLPLAESVRRALLGLCWDVLRRAGPEPSRPEVCRRCPALTGKAPDGTPLRGHRHAFFLPADEDGDGRIDHVTVVAEGRFTSDEVGALGRLREVAHGEGDPLRVLLVGLGGEQDVRSPLFAESAVWLSATPFLASRYPKLRGRKRDRPEQYATSLEFARHVLGEELERWRERRRAVPEVLAVSAVERQVIRPIEFARFRRKSGDDGGRRPSGAFRVSFAAPVRGPLCVGHSCHFGLGLFRGDGSRMAEL